MILTGAVLNIGYQYVGGRLRAYGRMAGVALNSAVIHSKTTFPELISIMVKHDMKFVRKIHLKAQIED